MISESGSWDSAGHWRKLWPGTEPVQPSNKKTNWILSWLWKRKERHEAALKLWRTCVMGRHLVESDFLIKWVQTSTSPNGFDRFPCHICHICHVRLCRTCAGARPDTRPELAVTCRRPVGPFCSYGDSMLTQRWVSKKNSSRRGAWFQPRISPWWPGDAWDTGTWVTIKKTNGRQRDQHKPT